MIKISAEVLHSNKWNRYTRSGEWSIERENESVIVILPQTCGSLLFSHPFMRLIVWFHVCFMCTSCVYLICVHLEGKHSKCWRSLLPLLTLTHSLSSPHDSQDLSTIFTGSHTELQYSFVIHVGTKTKRNRENSMGKKSCGMRSQSYDLWMDSDSTGNLFLFFILLFLLDI